MLRKLGRAMTGYDLLHHLLLHKSPRPIARRALLIRKELFDCVVIQRGHVTGITQPTSRVPSRCEVVPPRLRWHDRATRLALGGSCRLSPFAELAWRSSGLPLPFPQPVLLPAPRHTNLGIARDRFSALPQTPAALPSADSLLAANRPIARAPGQARRARPDACPEYPPHSLRV